MPRGKRVKRELVVIETVPDLTPEERGARFARFVDVLAHANKAPDYDRCEFNVERNCLDIYLK